MSERQGGPSWGGLGHGIDGRPLFWERWDKRLAEQWRRFSVIPKLRAASEGPKVRFYSNVSTLDASTTPTRVM